LSAKSTVSVVHVVDSSLANVNSYCTIKSAQRATEGVIKIHLSEGPTFFIREFYLPWPIPEVPVTLDAEKSADLVRAGRFFCAERHALSLLTRAEQSSGGLSIKLARKGFSQQETEPVLHFLQKTGLLDDYRFASLWIASRLRRHPDGRRNLVSGLVSRGVPITVAQSAVYDLCGPLIEERSCEQVAAKLFQRGRTPVQIDSSLRFRGFTHSVIKKTITKLNRND